jgi:hypothetical protein
MSTEIVTPATATEIVRQERAPVAIGTRGVELHDLEGLYRFSKYVAMSPFAPKGMETPETILVALQMGFELGLSPMSALQNVAVINGRPGIYGDAALALVRNSGVCRHYSEAETNKETDSIFRELQFAIIEEDADAIKVLQKQFAIAQGKHDKEAPDFGVTTATLRADGSLEFGRFTVGDAKKAGLWGKGGPWSQYPARMLKFRSRGFLLRDVYGDVLKGFKTTEELDDTPPIQQANVREIKRANIPLEAAKSVTVIAEEVVAPSEPAASAESSTEANHQQEEQPAAIPEPAAKAAPKAEKAAQAKVVETPAEPAKPTAKKLVKSQPAATENPDVTEIRSRCLRDGLSEETVIAVCAKEKWCEPTDKLPDLPENVLKAIIEYWDTFADDPEVKAIQAGGAK